jgi:hypothetical protein
MKMKTNKNPNKNPKTALRVLPQKPEISDFIFSAFFKNPQNNPQNNPNSLAESHPTTRR